MIDSNTKNMDANMVNLVNNLRKETGSHDGTETNKEAGIARVAKITKPAKVPTWTFFLKLRVSPMLLARSPR